MTKRQADPAPAATRERLEVLDALRGFALCGILLINLPHMGWIMESGEWLPGNAAWTASGILWWPQMMLVHGNMRGLFSLLFGASMLLFLAKAERGSATRGRATTLMLRRLFWLFAFGVVNMTLLLWPGDILNIYAMAGLIVLPFATARPRTLALAATAVIAGVSIYMVANQLPKRAVLDQGPALQAQVAAGRSLDSGHKEVLDKWRDYRAGDTVAPAAVAKERAVRLAGYGANLAYLSNISWEWMIDWKETLRWVFDAAGFMLVGMLLYRLGWLQGDAPLRAYAALILIGYGAGLPLKAIEAVAEWRINTGQGDPQFWQFLLPAATMQTARLLVTLGHVGLFLWCWKTLRLSLRPLQALGRMAFTGYLLQSALGAVTFSGFGLGLWGRLDLVGLFVASAIIWAIEIVFAVAWLSRFSMGPLEWVWRTLTYGEPPAIRQMPAPAPAA